MLPPQVASSFPVASMQAGVARPVVVIGLQTYPSRSHEESTHYTHRKQSCKRARTELVSICRCNNAEIEATGSLPIMISLAWFLASEEEEEGSLPGMRLAPPPDWPPFSLWTRCITKIFPFSIQLTINLKPVTAGVAGANAIQLLEQA